jgi:hypothetical protein
LGLHVDRWYHERALPSTTPLPVTLRMRTPVAFAIVKTEGEKLA